MAGLTQVQADCLGAIKRYQAEHGCAPSFAELRDHLGLSSASSVSRLLNALQERGHVRRSYHRARSIEIVERSVDVRLLERMTDAELRRHIAVASGILAHRTGGGRLTPASTASAPGSRGGRFD